MILWFYEDRHPTPLRGSTAALPQLPAYPFTEELIHIYFLEGVGVSNQGSSEERCQCCAAAAFCLWGWAAPVPPGQSPQWPSKGEPCCWRALQHRMFKTHWEDLQHFHTQGALRSKFIVQIAGNDISKRTKKPTAIKIQWELRSVSPWSINSFRRHSVVMKRNLSSHKQSAPWQKIPQGQGGFICRWTVAPKGAEGAETCRRMPACV